MKTHLQVWRCHAAIGRSCGLTVGVLVITSFCALAPLRAQDDIPKFNVYGSFDSSLPLTAGIAKENIADVRDSAQSHRSLLTFGFPTDSVRWLMTSRARQWLVRLGTRSPDGLQSASFAAILVAADDDSAAQQVIAKHLAAPGVSLADRAFTLAMAVEIFADTAASARLTIAEHYLHQLNTLGVRAAQRRYEAEITMVNAYDALGRSADVVRHGIAAMHLVPYMGTHDLEALYYPTLSPYPTIARAVAIQPGGTALIQEMNGILAAKTIPPPDSVAMDSNFYYKGQQVVQDSKDLLALVARVGTIPGSIASNRWLNRPDSTPGNLVVNDGTIRIVEDGNLGCIPCVVAAGQLQSLADGNPSVHPVLITETDANISNRAVVPDSSAAFATNYWLNHIHIRYPIALWIAYQRDTLSDGSINESVKDDSALVRYPEFASPAFYVLDGQGRIRASFSGWGTQTGVSIVRIIHNLEAEQKAKPISSVTQ